jgi:two-component system, NarL family, response regulator LiaR
MPTDIIRLVIVDDHEAVRRSLQMVMDIYDNIEVIGEASNGQEAVALCQKLQPDLVLMDLLMPVMDGVTATQIIRQNFPHIRVLILTSGIDPDMISAALRAGAQSYIEKQVNIEALTQAIWAAIA